MMPKGRVLRRGPSNVRRVAITFDDGPDGETGQYLDLLDKLDVPATFFILGNRSRQQPDSVREYVRRGHQIAGHGYDHQRFSSLSFRDLDEQLRQTEQALGPQPTGRPWVRPPHGDLSARSLAQLVATGYVVAMWSFDSCDYKIHDPAVLAAQCTPDKIAPGEVMLFHEGQEWTREALPLIVERLRADGYECVTMADLFAA